MGKLNVLNMCSGTAEVKIENEYTRDDLPKFFKDRSKDISKKFSDRRVKISTIRSKKIGNNNEFSFELRLWPEVNTSALIHKQLYNSHASIFYKIKDLIAFFKAPLYQGKIFITYVIKIGDKELIITKNIFDKALNIVDSEKDGPIWDILDKIGKHALDKKNMMHEILIT